MIYILPYVFSTKSQQTILSGSYDVSEREFSLKITTFVREQFFQHYGTIQSLRTHFVQNK